MNCTISRFVVLITTMAAIPFAQATTLVYQPINPNFGGDAANGANLLNEANAQNKYTAPSQSSSSSTSESTLDQFNQELQQAILSRVASSVTNSIVGSDGTLKPGTISTGNFTIVVSAINGGNLQITTTDNSTGASSTFVISNGQ